MSKVLTEVDTFTATITVPEGTDSRDTAADVVEALSQGLANRTKRLNLHTAKIDEENTFTEAQIINSTLDVNGTGQFDDLTVVDGFQVGGDAQIPSVVGNTGFAADVLVSGDLAVTGDATIPDIAGNVTIDGDLIAGDIDATGDIFAGDDVIATGDFQYGGGIKSRSTYLNMFRGEGQWLYSSAGAVRHMEAGNTGDAQAWPICLPHGATLTEVRMLVDKAGGGSMTLRLYKKTANGAFSSAPSEAQVGSTDTETGSGVQTLAVLSLSEVIDLTAAEYYAFVIAGDAGDVAYQIRVQWQESAITYPGG